MSTVGRGMHVFKQAIALILARVRSKSPAIYQELPLPPYLDLEERTPSRLWARCSLYYCTWCVLERFCTIDTILSFTGISFLSNVLLVICSLSGYIISGDRDSDQATNCKTFNISFSRLCLYLVRLSVYYCRCLCVTYGGGYGISVSCMSQYHRLDLLFRTIFDPSGYQLSEKGQWGTDITRTTR